MKNFLVSHIPWFAKPAWEKLRSSPLGYRLARGTFWSVVATAISRGLALIASIIVARMIGKIGFGEFGIIQSTVGTFGIFAGLGMGLTANKHVAELRVNDPARAGRVIGLSSLVAWISGLLMALLLLLIAPWLAANTLSAPHLTPLLRVASMLLLFSSVNGAQTGALAGFEAFKRIASVNLYSGIASFPLILAGVLWYGLEGAVWGLVISQAAGCIFSFLAIRIEAARSKVPLIFSGCWEERRLLWSFSLPAVFGGAVVGPAFWACSAMIANAPGGYAELGIFNAANQWRSAIQFLPSMMAFATLPVLSSLQSQGNKAKFLKLLKVNLAISFGLASAAALPVTVFSPWIMAAYGNAFSSGWAVLVILSLATVITATLNPIGQAIASQGKMWAGFTLNIVWAGVMLISCYLMRHFGALGLAASTLIAYLVHMLTSGFYVYLRMGKIFFRMPA